LQHACRFSQAALIDQSDAEIVVGVGVVGNGLQYSAVKLFRLREPSGLMELDGLPQGGSELSRLWMYRTH
jgi:hypothetical protein